MSATLPDLEAVLRDKSDHPGVAALIAAGPDILTGARWDRDEMTLTVAPEAIVAKRVFPCRRQATTSSKT